MLSTWELLLRNLYPAAAPRLCTLARDPDTSLYLIMDIWCQSIYLSICTLLHTVRQIFPLTPLTLTCVGGAGCGTVREVGAGCPGLGRGVAPQGEQQVVEEGGLGVSAGSPWSSGSPWPGFWVGWSWWWSGCWTETYYHTLGILTGSGSHCLD